MLRLHSCPIRIRDVPNSSGEICIAVKLGWNVHTIYAYNYKNKKGKCWVKAIILPQGPSKWFFSSIIYYIARSFQWYYSLLFIVACLCYHYASAPNVVGKHIVKYIPCLTALSLSWQHDSASKSNNNRWGNRQTRVSWLAWVLLQNAFPSMHRTPPTHRVFFRAKCSLPTLPACP